ncbi:hypothetical protein DFH06DRAFT_218828 [Mycena polygramma]|nr:hypothetical protein DFH06DRAFT_218828 [Mycena polygramma]
MRPALRNPQLLRLKKPAVLQVRRTPSTRYLRHYTVNRGPPSSTPRPRKGVPKNEPRRPTEFPARPPRKPAQHFQHEPPSTLRPRRLLPTDFCASLPPGFHRFYQSPTRQNPEVTLGRRHRGCNIAWTAAEPPEKCKGFLYCHTPFSVPHLVWSIRFRLTPDDYDPSSTTVSPQSAFAAGTDLQTPGAEGLPWSVPLWKLIRKSELARYRDLLRTDLGASIPDKWVKGKLVLEEDTVLYALGQPLLVEFHMPNLRVHMLRIGGGAPLVARLDVGYFDWAAKTQRAPYRGMGIMTVEKLADKQFGVRLQKILALTKVYPNVKELYTNGNIEKPVEGVTRLLEFRPVLFREAEKATHPRYIGSKQVVAYHLSALPHFSEVEPKDPLPSSKK